MSDVIEQLRGRADQCRSTHPVDAEIDYKAADEIERLTAERRELFRAGFFAGVDEFCPDDVHISDLATLEENQWNCRKWAEENAVQDTEGGDDE